MKRLTLVVLSLPLLACLIVPPAYSQPTPIATPSPSASGSISPSPSPTTASQEKPRQTSVKISTSGLELIGFPVWIIWVLIVVAVVGVVLWILLRRGVLFKSEEQGSKSPFIASAIVLGVFVMFVTFLIGDWWGRRGAKDEVQVQETIEGPVPQSTPTPQATPAPPVTSTPQPASIPQSNVGDVSAAWPLYTVVMGVVLLVGFEAAIFMYIYLRWGRGRKEEIRAIERILDRGGHIDLHIHK